MFEDADAKDSSILFCFSHDEESQDHWEWKIKFPKPFGKTIGLLEFLSNHDFKTHVKYLISQFKLYSSLCYDSFNNAQILI